MTQFYEINIFVWIMSEKIELDIYKDNYLENNDK